MHNDLPLPVLVDRLGLRRRVRVGLVLIHQLFDAVAIRRFHLHLLLQDFNPTRDCGKFGFLGLEKNIVVVVVVLGVSQFLFSIPSLF